MKKCKRCQRDKQITEFYKKRKNIFREICKTCSGEVAAQWQRDNPVKRRAKEKRWRENNFLGKTRKDLSSGLKQRYGITIDARDNLLEDQGGRCAICNKDIQFVGKSGAHIDHDHATGRIRSVLCASCNLGLGRFKDNVEFLRNAADYLEATHYCQS